MNTIAKQTLKSYFGFDSFRPMQEEVVIAALNGHDVLALMPTGGGKSLCYQVPALATEGVCLVVSPLIALMNDQMLSLRKKNITAFCIHTGMRRKDIISVLEAVLHSNCKFLFVSPERLETALFQEYLPGLGINFIAVDEAHCISQWGYDFRPPYLRIALLRQELPGVPVIALTASATPQVQRDVCDKLSVEGGNPFLVFRQSFERPNLSYSTFKVASRINKTVSILNNVQGSAIVYCKTRKRTKEISELLSAQGISSDFYNAGLSTHERATKQEQWIKNKIRVMVCTNAFGMGIDKPDVRVVIHADVPDCIENYYQEAGRAGRDAEKAFAVLLYDDDEIEMLKQLPDTRHPSLDTIRQVYSSVVNYLQLPEGEPPDESYDFNLKDFVKKFNLDVQTTIYGLKALEQDGWLSFNEQVFAPATARFTIYKEYLYEYEKKYTEYDPLIKILLRTYEGIYDYPVAISESYISYILKCDVTEVKAQLQRLALDRVIAYQPQKDEPQVMLTRTRIKSSLLSIDMKKSEERKLIFTERIKSMIAYMNNNATCRSKMVGIYFGDNEMQNCGICDNCLSAKKTALSKDLFDELSAQLENILQQAVSTQQVLQQLHRYPQEHVWTVLNFLVEEEKITVQLDGRLICK